MNKEHKQLAGYNTFIGVILGVLIGVVPHFYLKEAVPYKAVRVTSLDKLDNGTRLTANFIKTDCEFRKLSVFGINLRGDGVEVPWSPVDKPTKTEDRMVGSQTLVIEITTNNLYDDYEIRTRHNCSGVTVDKTFATISI